VLTENDMTAPNKAQQVLQACLAIRCFPERPARIIILRSNKADNAVTIAHAVNTYLKVGVTDRISNSTRLQTVPL
jgi:hypothetical protein